jgi:hypothetical protein
MSTRLVVAVGVVALLSASHPIAQRKAVQVGTARRSEISTQRRRRVRLRRAQHHGNCHLSDADFDQAAARVRQVGLPVPATNLFLPAALKVTGPASIATSRWRTSRRRSIGWRNSARRSSSSAAAARASARRVPERRGVPAAGRLRPPDRAGSQGRGITVTIEPLRRQETNIINSAGEGLGWWRRSTIRTFS